MAQEAVGISPARGRGGRREWSPARLDDTRYPRPKVVAALRGVGRAGWLPVSMYVGNAATSL